MNDAVEAIRDAAEKRAEACGGLGCHAVTVGDQVLIGIAQAGGKFKAAVLAVEKSDYDGLKLAAALGFDMSQPTNTVERAKRAAKKGAKS